MYNFFLEAIIFSSMPCLLDFPYDNAKLPTENVMGLQNLVSSLNFLIQIFCTSAQCGSTGKFHKFFFIDQEN